MHKGDLIDVYEDPQTRQQLEGRARLITPVLRGGEPLIDADMGERWLVRFDGEGEPPVQRWVYPQAPYTEAAS